VIVKLFCCCWTFKIFVSYWSSGICKRTLPLSSTGRSCRILSSSEAIVADHGFMFVFIFRWCAWNDWNCCGMNEIHLIFFSFFLICSFLLSSVFSTQFYAVVSTALHFHFCPLAAFFVLCLFLTFLNHCHVFGFVSLFRFFASPCIILCVTHDIVETVLHNSMNSLCRVDDCSVTAFDHGLLTLIHVCPSLMAERMHRISRNHWSRSQIWWTGKCDRTAGRQW
jgi:hypothetical protein